MGFLQLAKLAVGAESDKSDRSPLRDDLLSHNALLSPGAVARRTADDGCELHGITAEDVARGWERVEELIAGTPDDDHDAQWSVVSVCPCCSAPARAKALLCSPCDGNPQERHCGGWSDAL